MSELTALSLTQARDGLKKKSFSAQELAAAHVAAMEKARALNAFVLETGERAAAMAKACDARIAVNAEEIEHLKGELNAILAWVEQLQAVDVSGVEPMTSVTPMKMKMRADEVTDGGKPEDIVKNAPQSEDNFFLVPKVVE